MSKTNDEKLEIRPLIRAEETARTTAPAVAEEDEAFGLEDAADGACHGDEEKEAPSKADEVRLTYRSILLFAGFLISLGWLSSLVGSSVGYVVHFRAAESGGDGGDGESESYDHLSKTDSMLLSTLTKTPSVRKRAIDLIVGEYIRADSTLKAYDKLDYALDIMELMESDGEPVQVEGRPHLSVGGVGALNNGPALRRAGITHVVNWSPQARCGRFDFVEYLCVTDVEDYADMDRRRDELDAAVDFIERARRAGGRAMSQCWHGRNRSVTALAAYLMKYEGMDAIDAWRLIKRTRDIADPYQDVLYHYCHRELGRDKRRCRCFWDSFAEDYMNVQCED